MKEFFDLSVEHNGDPWFVVTTIVEDPQNLTEPFVTSTNFKKQKDAAGFSPNGLFVPLILRGAKTPVLRVLPFGCGVNAAGCGIVTERPSPLSARLSLVYPIGGVSWMVLTSLSALSKRVKPLFLLALFALAGTPLLAQGEAELKLPDLGTALFQGINGRTLLMVGLVVAVLGLVFGLVMYTHLRNLPVHESMLEISELIYETCKTYLITQGKFLMILEVFIGAIIVLYFGCQRHAALQVLIILVFSLIGIAGSYGVAWFGIRVNTFANSRTAFASLRGKPFPCYAIPLKAGMSIGMLLISVELLIMLCILLFIPGDYAGPCFIGFAIGESLGAAALRVAGGIFTKIADIGADLMKIVFKIKEDDARNPGVIADCTGDNAGDSVGPSADGFETYGVTGVALITFILLAVNNDIKGGTAGVDLRHARHDDHRQRALLLHQ